MYYGLCYVTLLTVILCVTNLSDKKERNEGRKICKPLREVGVIMYSQGKMFPDVLIRFSRMPMEFKVRVVLNLVY